MNTFTTTLNSLAAKLGIGAGLLKFLLFLLVFPFGVVLLGVLFALRKMASAVRKVGGWLFTEPALTLLVLGTIVWLGVVGWRVYERFQEHHLSIAAGGRTTESYRLARALQSVTTLHAPRFRLVILEIEGAASDEGTLEKGVVQLASAPAELPTGPSARSVALWAGTKPQLLLARYDVDEGAVYALLQVLTQFSAELAPVKANDKASGAAPAAAATWQQPTAKSAVPLHPGAAAFYDRERTPFLYRYAKLLALVLTGLVLLALWGGRWRYRSLRRSGQPLPRRFSPATDREPWTFAKILQESVATASRSEPRATVARKSRFRPTTWKAQ